MNPLLNDYHFMSMQGVRLRNPMGMSIIPDYFFSMAQSIQVKRRDAMIRKILRRKWLLTYTLLILVTSLLFSVALVGIFILSTMVQSSWYGILAVEALIIIYLVIRIVINPEEVTYKHKKTKYWYYNYF